MKRVISFLLSLVLLLSLLPACSPQEAESSDPPVDETEDISAAPVEEGLSCAEIMTGVLRALDMEDSPTAIYGAADEEPERLPAYIEETYGLAGGEWVDAYVARKGKSYGMEMTIVRCADEEAAAHALECLEEYSVRRLDDFDTSRYGQSLEKSLMAHAALLCRGEYAALFACYGRAYAAQLFARMVDTGETPEPAAIKEDMDAQMDLLLAYCAAEGDDVSAVERINSGDTDRLRFVIEGEYGLTDDSWEEAVIARGMGGSVFEIALLRFGDDLTASDGMYPLAEYLDAKEVEYARFPAQAKLLYDAEVTVPVQTHYVVLSVSTANVDWELARYLTDGHCNSFYAVPRHDSPAALDDAPAPSTEPDPNYPDRAKFAPPNEEDMSLCDTSAIRAAWEAGDPAGLSDADRAVYDAAKEILGEILRDGMTGLEKETAIFTWLVDNVNYDWSHMDIMAETPRTSYEPYGALVDRSAVCLGYATGFQLLMDLAGVECITVIGADFNGTGDHAWNMARLDGNWYCVDVTWDANSRELLGESSKWNYFNLTSDEMAKSHQWDYANVPEA